MVRVKICGITSVEEAQAAVRAGADAIGLQFLADSPYCLTEQLASDIRLSLPPFVSVVGVFADRPMRDVHRLATRLELTYVQLQGSEPADSLWHFKCPVIRAFRVRGPEILPLLGGWDDVAAAVLIDGLGTQDDHDGPGFDWKLLDAVRASTSLPLMLGGPLHTGNVAAAVEKMQPFAVDTNLGVERKPGRKDEGLMREFVIRAKTLHSPHSEY